MAIASAMADSTLKTQGKSPRLTWHTSAGPGIPLLCLQFVRPIDQNDQAQGIPPSLKNFQEATLTALFLEDGRPSEHLSLKQTTVRTQLVVLSDLVFHFTTLFVGRCIWSFVCRRWTVYCKYLTMERVSARLAENSAHSGMKTLSPSEAC